MKQLNFKLNFTNSLKCMKAQVASSFLPIVSGLVDGPATLVFFGRLKSSGEGK